MHTIRAILVAGVLLMSYPSLSQLKWPAVTAETRPWTRWWWMGNAVNKKDLTSSMEKYRDAGLGGLELTPIYGVKGYEAQFIPYLSPGWMDMLDHTIREARRLGLGIDMANGTGWPFGGGPLIDQTYSCKDFVYKIWSLHTGESLKDTVQYIQEPLVRTDGGVRIGIDDLSEPVYQNKDLQRLALFQVKFGRVLPMQALVAYNADGAMIDLTGKVDASGRLGWIAPAGNWTLYAIFQGWHGKMVERAAPGGEGNVIDHFSQEALQRYLSRFDTAFKGHDLRGVRAFFNDSYEVDDARGQSNWTPGFFDAFRQRRGYDLREHLPALLGRDTKENNERVLCDYRETISDLLLERFTIPWRSWAKGKGAIIRNQAHGSPANILDLYAASDIPETEGSDIFRYKFATSAAHVSGKRLVSSESLTWLNEHFLSTPADEKRALDNYLLGGVNHIFYHGTAYSPASDPWPGWLFYASVHFTPNDPSWRNFSTLNQYVTRCQSFLQQGMADDDVLLYYPLYDSWMETGGDLLKHYDRMSDFDVKGFEDCAEMMSGKGYAFDYVSDKQVLLGTAGEERIRMPGGTYKTIVIPGCRLISAAAFDKLVQLATSGVNVIFYKDLPVDVPGWNAQDRRRADFQALCDRIKASGVRLDGQWEGIEKAVVGKGAFLKGGDLGQLLEYTRVRREVMGRDSLQFVRRRYGQGHCYFLVNGGSKKWEGFVPVAVDFSAAAIFNPMDGMNGTARWRQAGRGGKEIYLQLLPGESCLVETFAAPVQAPAYPYYRGAGGPLPVTGKWKIEFMEGGPVLPGTLMTEQLGSWTELGEDEKKFSGTAKYSVRFRRMSGGSGSTRGTGRRPAAWLLDLGKVNESARVFLNGKKIAELIGPYYQVVISDMDMRNDNLLEVQVSNLMVNRIEYLDRAEINWKRFYNYNFPPHLKANRGENGLFDASRWEPVESGLSGPVTLTAIKY